MFVSRLNISALQWSFAKLIMTYVGLSFSNTMNFFTIGKGA
jgi:hypothetical protein